MKTTQIGWLKHGDVFSFQGIKYKVGHVIDGTNGYVSCIMKDDSFRSIQCYLLGSKL